VTRLKRLMRGRMVMRHHVDVSRALCSGVTDDLATGRHVSTSHSRAVGTTKTGWRDRWKV
jgi:hypothetical protein